MAARACRGDYSYYDRPDERVVRRAGTSGPPRYGSVDSHGVAVAARMLGLRTGALGLPRGLHLTRRKRRTTSLAVRLQGRCCRIKAWTLVSGEPRIDIALDLGRV